MKSRMNREVHVRNCEPEGEVPSGDSTTQGVVGAGGEKPPATPIMRLLTN